MGSFPRMFALTSTLLLIVEVSSQNYSSWREGYEGHGTTHEQIGQLHWPMPEYTPYIAQRNYSDEPAPSSTALIPIYNFTNFLFRIFLTDTKDLPLGKLKLFCKYFVLHIFNFLQMTKKNSLYLY